MKMIMNEHLKQEQCFRRLNEDSVFQLQKVEEQQEQG